MRGVHKDDAGSPNMNPPEPAKQGDFSAGGKRPFRQDPGNSTKAPTELRGGIDAGGNKAFNAEAPRTVEFSKADSRDTHK